MDKDDIALGAKSAWDKLVSAVKSAPATFLYGLAIGAALGAFVL